MNYALLENNTITNIIWLYPGNADEFPNAVPLGNVPAGIGDTYEDGNFYRNGERILTASELAYQMSQALATLGIDETTLEGEE